VHSQWEAPAADLTRTPMPNDRMRSNSSTTKTSRRTIYRRALAQPLKLDEKPEDKLSLLCADLGVSKTPTGDDWRSALLAFAQRHISGFRHDGPKRRRYPPGPLRSLLKGDEQPEDKLPHLMQYYGAQTYRECLLAAAKVHVPGFSPASPMRTGGPRRRAVKTEKTIKPSLPPQ
jgi:hypothetical protein